MSLISFVIIFFIPFSMSLIPFVIIFYIPFSMPLIPFVIIFFIPCELNYPKYHTFCSLTLRQLVVAINTGGIQNPSIKYIAIKTKLLYYIFT